MAVQSDTNAFKTSRCRGYRQSLQGTGKFPPSITKGDRFPAVKAVQKTIGAKKTGTWSSASVKKLKKFQAKHDLEDTGRLSYDTWRALEKAAWPR